MKIKEVQRGVRHVKRNYTKALTYEAQEETANMCYNRILYSITNELADVHSLKQTVKNMDGNLTSLEGGSNILQLSWPMQQIPDYTPHPQ